MTSSQSLGFQQVSLFLSGLFGGDLHAKRVLSLANATLGVVRTASLAVNTIGLGLAQARGLLTRHATKQVDRMLSNEGIDVDAALRHWIPYVVGPRTSINVAMDWTDFDADVLPAAVQVCIVADRGFGDRKLYRVLTEELKFDYVIRFRGNIAVTAEDGETRTALAWVGPGGRAKVLPGAAVTAARYRVGTVLCVQDADMKQAWCLATSTTVREARDLIRLYGKRWGIECGLRDTKDLRFGMGMGAIHVSTPARRDRLWLLNAFAAVLLTLLGAAGEALGYDRHLKTNTTKRRTHSLFRQGCMLYDLMPNMPQDRLLPLVERFAQMLTEVPAVADTFAAI